MQFISKQNFTKYVIYDDEGNIRSKSIIICSEKGWGKSMCSEVVVEKFYKAGVVCIIIGDPKNQLEPAFSLFKPEKAYHLADLKKTGRKPETLPLTIYHPFTFNIPKNKKLFPMQLYTIPIKDFTREMWSFLCESYYSDDNIRTIMTKTRSISEKAEIYDFLHSIQDSILGMKGKSKIKYDKDLFALQTTAATQKSIQDIASYFSAFQLDYFISNSNNPLSFDIAKICNDNSKIHYFPNYFIQDSKMRAFVTFMIFALILENQNYINKKLLIYMPEIKSLFPLKTRGYSDFVVTFFKKTLNLIRSQGVGISFLCDTQSFSDVNTAITNNLERFFIGQTKSAEDLSNLQKKFGFNNDLKKQLQSMPKPGTYHIIGEHENQILKTFLPCHMHCEEEYNFYKMYKKHYPDKMVTYQDIWNQRRKEFEDQATKYEDLMKQRIKAMEEEQERKKEKKTDKKEIKKEAEEKIEKIKEKSNKSKEKFKQLVYEAKVKEALSFRKLAEKFGINKVTAKKYYEQMKEINENKRYDELDEDI